MGDYIKTIIIWLVAIACMVFTINYITSNVGVKNQSSFVSDTLQTTLLSNQQYSERVETKAFFLDKEAFEKSFVSKYSNKGDTNVSNIEFSYLPSKYSDNPNAISGVKVKVTTEESEQYQGTLLVDNGLDK